MAKNIYFRQGVYGDRLHDSMRKALPKIDKVFPNRKQAVLVTSTFESSGHRADSFHYQHKAIDVKDTSNNAINELIFKDLKKALGNDYDVVWHKGSHFHCEYDPD